MKIAKFARLSGIPAHTLRFYEQIGIITVQRLPNGHRDYGADEIEWIAFVQRLKDSGMPLHEIQVYGELRAQGDHTLGRRMDMLQTHRELLLERIRQHEAHLSALDDKIRHYQGRLDETADNI